MEKTNKRETGSRGEELAAEYLKKQGYRILERNFRNRTGEIDLIAMDGPTLVFAEVKLRKNAGSGAPEEAVTAAKQRNITKVAQYYMMIKGKSQDTDCRFDVVSIAGEEIRLIKNAFGAAY